MQALLEAIFFSGYIKQNAATTNSAMIIFHFLRRSSCTHEQFLSFALQKFLYARTVPFVCFAKVPLRTNSSFTHKQFLYAQTVPLRTNSSFTHKQFLYAQIVPFICFAEVFAEDCEPMKFRAARSLTHQPSFLFSL
ncbi:hypothetical protein HBH64_110820 [Parastagonospora nodorum]|nr:hypothetical protein HBI04_084910 [Parastagonospora nodorum]KAH4302538.1 hypothetical protein HBI02_141520 [Parastagonospora nodorum]KAH4374585.1 hypothetical protein HBH94_104600 [Parastagonospora nodorum]KAH4491154.1 hypothetical protein HBH88_115470 [Parastagonospora nodorum]KAH4686322.1 hypothetical protein HBH79_070760 [Parastagonospora nodorum]